MKIHYVADLSEGQQIADLFLVRQKSLRTTRKGNPYLSLTLGDKSGEIEARMWDGAEQAGKTFAANDFVYVEGDAQEYQGAVQLTVRSLRRVDPAEVDASDYLPAVDADVEVLLAELKDLCLSVSDRHIRKLMRLFFEDEAFVSDLKRAPAAKAMHHVYIGGLLQHTLSMVMLARQIADHYTCLDGDVLIAGALIHDMGKILEFEYTTGFDYSDEGRMVGHLLQGLRMLDEKLALIEDFPAETAMHLRHIIASHHGLPEYGSPRTPQTPEAVVLHHLDNLDAKVWAYVSTIEADSDQPGDFTRFHQPLGVHIYKGDSGRRPQKKYGFRIEHEQGGKTKASAKTRVMSDESGPSGDSLDLFDKKR